MTQENKQIPRILILGGGYGGLRVALTLQETLGENEAQITLINKHDYHYQTTLLHKVAIGTLSARKARIYYRKILNPRKITFIKEKVLEIHPTEKRVICSRSGYCYDYLVVALGFKPETFGVKGADKFTYKLSSLNAALKLTKNIENKFKDYTLTQDYNDLRVIVCGTGFTSIEFAAELATQLGDLCEICGINRDVAQVICIGRSERILPVFDDKLADIATQKLLKLGVKLITNAKVVECKENSVIVERNGIQEEIFGNTIVWGAGVRGSDVVQNSSLQNKRGRINVDPSLRSFEYPEIFVVGDCAEVKSKDVIHAPTAQLSAQMGDYVGVYLANLLRGKKNEKDFKFIHRGTVCSIGHTDGVGVVFGKNLQGELAAFMKNTIENRWLFSIGGFKMVFRKGQFRYRTSN